MAYIIVSPCVDVLDTACVEVCPVDCIHYEKGTERLLYIDPDECIDCAACEPVCPVTAIFEQDSVPANEKEYIAINAQWFKDKAAVRSKVDALKPPGTTTPPAHKEQV